MSVMRSPNRKRKRLLMPTPDLASVVLASRAPNQLRAWYGSVFNVAPDADGWLRFGRVAVKIESRENIADTAAEPARVIPNYHVADLQILAVRLSEHHAQWMVPVEYRAESGAWFATVADPDGNYLQLIQLTAEYWLRRRERRTGAVSTRTGLADASISARLPAQDLDRARAFYADRLGLRPVEQRDGALRYQCGGDSFALFTSSGRPSGEHTQLAFYVADIEQTVADLRERGLVFDKPSIPDLPSRDGIVDIPGNYPSTGATGERAIWFHDSEGNLLGLAQFTMPS